MAENGNPNGSTRMLHGTFLAALLALALGCPGGDSLGRRAEAVYRDTMAANPEYRKYGLEIASHTDSPVVRQMLIEAAGDDNFQTALVAVKALAAEPSPEAQPALRQVFQDKRGALRLQAAVVVAGEGDEAALDFLREQIADPAQNLNLAAVEAVAGQGGREFLEPILRRRMASDSQATRDEVCAALGQIGEPWATQLLIEALNNETGEARKQAIVSLGRTQEPKAAVEIERFVNTQGLVFATLEALGRLGNTGSLEAVRVMADNDEPAVRVYAGVALLRLGQADEALAILEPLAASEDATVRSVLAEQLAGVDDANARRILADLAADPEKAVRIAALRSLGADPRPDAATVLVRAARDGEYEVQTLALNVLARVGRAADLESIGPLLDDENPYTALSAAQAVLSIQGRLAPA